MHFGIVSLSARSRWLSTELQGPKSSLFGPDPSLGIPRGRSGCSKSTQAAHFENARRVATHGTRIFEDMARRIRTDFKNSGAIGTARVDLVRSRVQKLLFRPPLGVSHTRAKSKNPKNRKIEKKPVEMLKLFKFLAPIEPPVSIWSGPACKSRRFHLF